ALQPGQTAAAVNLGIFPDSGAPALATNTVASPYSTSSVGTNRLASIDELLQSPPASAAPAEQPSWQPAAATAQLAYAAPVPRPTPSVQPAVNGRKVWLQLASGPNAEALPEQFRRMKSRNRTLFDGISGYVARSTDRARLVSGPFRGNSDAEIFQEDLQSVGIDAFSWTNSDSDRIVPLGTE